MPVKDARYRKTESAYAAEGFISTKVRLRANVRRILDRFAEARGLNLTDGLTLMIVQSARRSRED